MKLSRRLETIISMVLPCRTAADIGCDHGFTAIRLIENGTARSAVCSDIGEGPLKRAREHICQAGLSKKIGCRKGNGLSTLQPGEADCVIIAGMGGMLISGILKEGREILAGVSELILSPHTEIPLVRETLENLNFRIDAEKMAAEDGKYYTVIRAVPGRMHLSDLEKSFGPCFLRERDEVFLSWVGYEIGLNREVADALKNTASSSGTAAREQRIRKIHELTMVLEGQYDSCTD